MHSSIFTAIDFFSQKKKLTYTVWLLSFVYVSKCLFSILSTTSPTTCDGNQNMLRAIFFLFNTFHVLITNEQQSTIEEIQRFYCSPLIEKMDFTYFNIKLWIESWWRKDQVDGFLLNYWLKPFMVLFPGET